jgi:hypothetical protein
MEEEIMQILADTMLPSPSSVTIHIGNIHVHHVHLCSHGKDKATPARPSVKCDTCEPGVESNQGGINPVSKEVQK